MDARVENSGPAADDGKSMLPWLVPRVGVAVGLLLSFLALMPFGGLYNIPLLVLCGLGLWCLASRPREAIGDDRLRLLLVLFLCIWLPMMIAAVDAVDPVQSWRKVASFLVFFLAGVYVLRALQRRSDLRLLLIGVWIICILWSIDASWQFIHGFNLFGFPYQGGRVSGVFHPDLKLGIVLATVSPLILEGMRILARRSVWVPLTLIPFFAAIVLSGSRSSWIVLFVVLVAYGWYLFRWAVRPKVRGGAVLRVAAVGVLACGALAYTVPQATSQMHELLVKRAAPVAHLLSGDAEKADGAIKARLSAWEIVGRVFRDHWFNGVGPRGFREVYADYAPASDPLRIAWSSLQLPAPAGARNRGRDRYRRPARLRHCARGARAQASRHGPVAARPRISLLAGDRCRAVSTRYPLGVLRALHGSAHLVDDCNLGSRSRCGNAVRRMWRVTSSRCGDESLQQCVEYR